MKVESKKQHPDFCPVQVSFVIETQEEFDILLDMFATNVSIPGLLSRENPNGTKGRVFEVTQQFMIAVRQSMLSAVYACG